MADLRRLPNLAALRAFEAAARHENFSRAAEEIHVTHGAISHQVRGLEEELGVALFVRRGKRLAITPEGRYFADAVAKSLLDIAHAAQAIQASARQKRVTISAMPSFASRWLAHRLGKFIDLHPDIEVILQSSGQLVDLTREPIDIGIRFGSGNYPGLIVDKLMGDYYYPVVSPHYNGGRLPATPQDLEKCALLRAEEEPWLPWFRLAGVDLPEPTGGLQIEDSSMMMRAVAAGDGVALSRHVIALQEIASGEVVRLFDVSLKCPSSYYVACTPAALLKPEVRAFRTWLFAEVEKFKIGCGWTADDD